MRRSLSDALRSAKHRLGEESEQSSPRASSLHHYIRRDNGPRGLATVDDLLGRSDPKAAENRLFSEGEDPILDGIRRLRGAAINDPASIHIPGRLMWRQVLEEQRGLDTPTSMKMVEEPNGVSVPEWPPIHIPNSAWSWSRWHTSPENHAVARGADLIMEEPGRRLSPFLVVGERGTGKSHFISALANSLQNVLPHLNVHLIHGREVAEVPVGAEEAFRDAGAILIDDADALIERGLDDALGRLVHIALDHGVQVVCTVASIDAFDALPTSAMRRSLTGAAIGRLDSPSDATLVAHLRRRCVSRGAAVDEHLLVAIVENANTWGGSAHALDIVLASIEAGSVPMDEKDIKILLDGRPIDTSSEVRSDWNPDVIGQRLVQTVLDDVLPQGIDVEVTGEVEIPPLSDGWSPAEFELPSGRLIPESQPQSAQGPQKVAPIISARIDERFSDAESELHRRRFALHEIERELETIQSRMAESTPADIVGLTDRLLALEGQLEAISETPLGEDLGPIAPFDPGVIEVEVNYPILRPVSGQVPHLEKAREKHGTAVLRKRKVKVPV